MNPVISSRFPNSRIGSLKFYEHNPDFIQPEIRRNEMIALAKSGLQDVNITRQGQILGHSGPVRPAVHDLGLVRRAADLFHRHRLRHGRSRVSKMVAREHPFHWQGHHPLSLHALAGDAAWPRD